MTERYAVMEQAAESLFPWRGVRPGTTQGVRAYLRGG